MQELVRQFGLDWKLLLAQVVNFLILLYLLERFAYGPIIAMLAERRRKIEEGIAASKNALQRLADAEKTRSEMILKAEQESLGVVSAAEDTAKVQARAILNAANNASEQVVASGHRKIEEDRLKLEEEVNAHAVGLIKRGLAATIGKMNPTERDEVLIKDALRALSISR